MLKSPYTIKEILRLKPENQSIKIFGWVRTFRNGRFISLSDGSCLSPLQIVCPENEIDSSVLEKITAGASLQIEGLLVESPAKGQALEVLAKKITILGTSDANAYPIQPKNHSLSFLREVAHWRGRTQLFQSIFKIRNALSYATHQFFYNKDFLMWHTPIITASDSEGAGEMFRVTNLDLNRLPKNEAGMVDDTQDFFGKQAHLTVSGQLEGELGMMSFGRIYTFGPTFRAENSNTARHLAEFWMIEPEMAFYDLDDNIHLAQEFVCYLIDYVLKTCDSEIHFLAERLAKEELTKPTAERSGMGLIERMKGVLNNTFQRISYTEAVAILKQSPDYKKNKFSYPVEWGVDLQSEHERYLVEKHFNNSPIVITDYPASIKAFYMRMNDDNKTVAAMDMLFPGIGEIIGGSQREERLDVLSTRMRAMGIDPSSMEWYMDTRRFGSVPHSGFGLGFERMLLFITGMSNIRDVMPFPRYPKGISF